MGKFGLRWGWRWNALAQPQSAFTHIRYVTCTTGTCPFFTIDHWKTFNRRNLNDAVLVADDLLVVFCGGDATQAVLWLHRNNSLTKKGIVNHYYPALPAEATMPGLHARHYPITSWNTATGNAESVTEAMR